MNIPRRKALKMLGGIMPAAFVPKAFSKILLTKNTEQNFEDHSLGTDVNISSKYNFNSGWKVFVGDPGNAAAPAFDDSSWMKRTLPYAWNENDAFKKSIDDLSTGIAWYRKQFRLPETCKGQKIFIECEGVRQAAFFYLNGKLIGKNENGVMAFGFDITKDVNFGNEENVLAVRTDNSWDYREQATGTKFQWNDKNFYANYGGMNKNIYIHVKPNVYHTLPLFSSLGTTGVYIYADEINIKEKSAVIHAECEIKNETQVDKNIHLEVVVSDVEGKVIKQFKSDIASLSSGQTKMIKAASLVDTLNFWSWGYGYLYDVQTILKAGNETIDSVVTRTGFRKTAFKDGMIYLNDRVIQVHGYAQRTTNEWPAIGLSVPAWLNDYSNGLMVEGNANLVRWMHVTPWKQDVESCDRVGLMQAMPAGDSEGDVKDHRWEQRKELMRDAIIYNRNNPSIIFYECGNKGILDAQMQEMKDIRDLYDPYGGRAIGAREMLASSVAEYGGEMLYIDKSATKPLWEMEFSRDEGLRKYWDNDTPPYHKDGDGPLYRNAPAPEYNHNMDSHAVENIKRWYEYWRVRPGTGRRVSSGGVNIVFADSNTHHRGSETYRTSGEVDAMRIKKQNFYANQIMWNGWVDTEQHGIHIIGHWNYKGGTVKDIFVVSTASRVELFCNGKSLGFGKNSDGFLFSFSDIKWEPGTLQAKGYDDKNVELCSHIVKTIGAPYRIRLSLVPRPVPFVADGHDLQLVEVEVVDKDDNRCPTALNEIQFNIEGPAEWKGGIAVGPDNYIGSKLLPVEGGVNRVLIRSATDAGKIKLSATAAQLKSGYIEFESLDFTTANGLSEHLPSQGLPVRLGRGATQQTASYKVSRIPVEIVSATAGANQEKAHLCFDDNETTGWLNDGRLETAWIELNLERVATIDAIDIKLNNFRTKEYPLSVKVGDTEVFKGKTERTLGYYSIACKPVKGNKVKISLDGFAKVNDNIEGEVSGQKLGDGIATTTSNAKGTLGIIEVEVYELVK